MNQDLKLFFCLVIFAASCSIKIEEKNSTLTKKQLEFFELYKTNDTLFFSGGFNQIDTILILFSNDLNIRIKHLPVDKWQNIKPGSQIEYQEFVSIPENPDHSIRMNFKDLSCTFIPDTLRFLNQLTFAGKDYSCYILNHKFHNVLKDNRDVQTLFWDKTEGLIAYRTKGGGTWVKISR